MHKIMTGEKVIGVDTGGGFGGGGWWLKECRDAHMCWKLHPWVQPCWQWPRCPLRGVNCVWRLRDGARLVPVAAGCPRRTAGLAPVFCWPKPAQRGHQHVQGTSSLGEKAFLIPAWSRAGAHQKPPPPGGTFPAFPWVLLLSPAAGTRKYWIWFNSAQIQAAPHSFVFSLGVSGRGRSPQAPHWAEMLIVCKLHPSVGTNSLIKGDFK